MLNSSDNLSKYNSNYQKALNLGIYGTDLGYTNIYEQNQDGIKYLSSIKSLAEGLNIGQFFDILTIWVMSFVLYIALYFELLRMGVDSFGKVNIPKQK